MRFQYLLGFYLVLMLVSSIASKADPSLSQLAHQELHSNENATSKKPASHDRVATVFVNLPHRNKEENQFWTFSLGYQNVALNGQKELEFVDQQNLSESSKSFSFLQARLGKTFLLKDTLLSEWGWKGNFGLGRTNARASSTSGRNIQDLQVQVYSTSISTFLAKRLLPWWVVGTSISYGFWNVTQVSSNTSARFSDSFNFYAPAVFTDFSISRSQSLGVRYEQPLFPTNPAIKPNIHQWMIQWEYRQL